VLLFLRTADILIINNHVVVHKCSAEGTNFYVVGSDTEVHSYVFFFCMWLIALLCLQNELILTAVLDAGYEAIADLLRDQLDQRSILDNLELVLLALDELIDTGVILEIDPKAIKNRVLMMDASASADPALGDMTIGEAFEKAKAQAKSGGWLSGWGRSSSEG
jgi:hypothetical protein